MDSIPQAKHCASFPVPETATHRCEAEPVTRSSICFIIYDFLYLKAFLPGRTGFYDPQKSCHRSRYEFW